MNFRFVYDWSQNNGQPTYRYFKLAFTIALRLGSPIELRKELQIDAVGTPTNDPKYKTRSNFQGTLTINGVTHDDIIFVVEESKERPELITFWRNGQHGDHPGTKGGAHPFAELYMGFLLGKTTEKKVFGTESVADLSREYNSDPRFNIQAWIVNNLPADAKEPPKANEPIEEPTTVDANQIDFLPELRLINKWCSGLLPVP